MTGNTILGFDPLAGTSMAGTLPLWAAGAAAALFIVVVVVAAIAFRRSASTGIFPTALRYSMVLVGALMVLTFLDRATQRDRQAERRALEARSVELTASAVVPGSALACLDSAAGDEVERACEKAVFANPETVAAAVSYVAARFALLGDGLDYAQHDSAYAVMLGGTRKALEADRFGILAHVLATHEGCAADNCPALKRLGDASRVQRNLRERTYAAQVARYVPTWAGKPASGAPDNGPSASAPGGAPPGAPPGAVPPAAVSSVPNVDFPSASSIPPVSIMNAEPAPGAPAAAAPAPKPAATAAAAPTPTPPRRPPPPARRTAPATAEAGAPIQIAPVTPTPFDNAGQPAAPAR
jgi:hypothetical protein